MITLNDQIACIQREIGFRQRCYPSWVAKNKMTQAESDRELARMEAVLETLKSKRVEQEYTTNFSLSLTEQQS